MAGRVPPARAPWPSAVTRVTSFRMRVQGHIGGTRYYTEAADEPPGRWAGEGAARQARERGAGAWAAELERKAG